MFKVNKYSPLHTFGLHYYPLFAISLTLFECNISPSFTLHIVLKQQSLPNMGFLAQNPILSLFRCPYSYLYGSRTLQSSYCSSILSHIYSFPTYFLAFSTRVPTFLYFLLVLLYCYGLYVTIYRCSLIICFHCLSH